jgi:hypothetical protein
LWEKEHDERMREEECDHWFNRTRPMTSFQKTWKEKHIKKEEKSDDSDNFSAEGNVVRMVADINMVF